ncbi:MAG TPA: Ig-like domain-containing protein [Xanthobacteraceae bacterium]|nr:Ig-like domain-containing protein [Xanthobacteraceae bacterium]
MATSGIQTKILRVGPAAPRDDGGMIVPGSQWTRPLWFDGRFLGAPDLARDQHDFLRRQAEFGRAAGFGVVHGLMVQRVAPTGQPADAETIVISAGHGLTPSGQLVMIAKDLTVRLSDLAEAQSLNTQFGLSAIPAPLLRARTGLYVIGLRPVQFTANPIASYPTSVQGQQAQDGDIIEATAVSLVPYPLPANNAATATLNAAAARQIFVTGDAGQTSASLLPLAMVSIAGGAIEWVDSYLVRRESGPEFAGLRFGLAQQAAQQAFLLQYDAQLRQAVTTFGQNPPRFAATDYFQALPPAGRFPLASLNTAAFTQLFFPPQADVRLRLVPDDELPALIDESMTLPPIDLTLATSAYADLAIFALVVLPRQQFAAQAATLPQVQLSAALPQAPALGVSGSLAGLVSRSATPAPSTATSNAWSTAIGTQVYGYYMRRRSFPVFVSPDQATVSSSTTLAVTAVPGTTGWSLRATVSPSSATGTVTFADGATNLGTVDLTAATATLIWPSLASGAHQLKATYNGDTNLANSSTTVNQTV